jgi:two-component system sensor histidine kinase PilS (NtrC family)
MPQGVLVVDEKLRVRSANPAALVMMGLSAQHPLAALKLSDQAGWVELVDTALLTFARGTVDRAEIHITQRSRVQVHLTVNTQTTVSIEATHRPMCVMFMQDLRESEAKLRTEKLASMGRMSAAVAHEIRNPLAAISQANALQRLGRIVDDILDVARIEEVGATTAQDTLALDAHVRQLCQEWAVQHGVGPRLQLALGAREVLVAFRADHLRRILVNLLDNAARYATHADGAIQVSTHAEPGGPVLAMVWSDGQALDQGVQKHLFEPFFSSESRSSGLGLYICQELCHRNGGTIAYERTPRQVDGQARQGNEFFISLNRWQPATASP